MTVWFLRIWVPKIDKAMRSNAIEGAAGGLRGRRRSSTLCRVGGHRAVAIDKTFAYNLEKCNIPPLVFRLSYLGGATVEWNTISIL